MQMTYDEQSDKLAGQIGLLKQYVSSPVIALRPDSSSLRNMTHAFPQVRDTDRS